MKSIGVMDCCAAAIQYGFYKYPGNRCSMFSPQEVEIFLKENERMENFNGTRMSIVILDQTQYEYLMPSFKEFGYERMATTRGNNGIDIHLLLKKTREVERHK